MTAVDDVALPMGLADAVSAEDGRLLLARDQDAVSARTVAALEAAGTALADAGDQAGAEDLADWSEQARALTAWRTVLRRAPSSQAELTALVTEVAPGDRFFDLGVDMVESALADYTGSRWEPSPAGDEAAAALDWARTTAGILRVLAAQTSDPGHRARAGYAAGRTLIAPSAQDEGSGQDRDTDAVTRARPFFQQCAGEETAPVRLRFESLRFLAWIAGPGQPGEVAVGQAAAEELLAVAPGRDLPALRAIRRDRAWRSVERGDDAAALALLEANLADTERELFAALAGQYAAKVVRGSEPDYADAIDARLRLARAADAATADTAAAHWDRVLELAEAGKARALAHALATRVDHPASSPFLLQRRSRIEAEIEAEIERVGTAEGSPRRLSQLRDALADNEQRRLAGGTVLRDLGLTQPRTADEIRALVPAGGALLSYHWSPTRLVICVVREDGPLAAPVTVPIPADDRGGDRVGRAVLLLNAAIRGRGGPAAVAARTWPPDGERTEELWPEQFQHYLYEQLIAPVADRIADRATLIVSPHGPLRDVPFPTLLDRDGSALIDQHAIAYTDGALMLAACRQRRRTGLRTCFAAGPGAAAVAGLFGAEPAAATTPAVLEDGSTADVVHLSGPAQGATAAPSGPGLVLDDGTLSGERIAAASFAASLVTLAAIQPVMTAGQPPSGQPASGQPASGQSAAGRPLAGRPLAGRPLAGRSAAAGVDPDGSGTERDGPVGAFLRAGVPLVAATRWPLAAEVAPPFCREFYTALAGGETAAEALRTAQRALRSASQFRHPYYWAPFALWGDATTPFGGPP